MGGYGFRESLGWQARFALELLKPHLIDIVLYLEEVSELTRGCGFEEEKGLCSCV